MNETEAVKMPDISGYSLRRALSLIRKIGLVPGRVTYVIDREGRIVRIFDEVNVASHGQEVLESLPS